MSKRRATTTLTKDNWDDEPEEDQKEKPGDMPIASPEEIKKRVIVAAKRRSIGGASKSGVFSGFGGFISAQSTSTASGANGDAAKPQLFSSFSFGNGNNQHDQQPSSVSSSQLAAPINGTTSSIESTSKIFKKSGDHTDGSSADESHIKPHHRHGSSSHDPHREMCKHLKALNEGVLNWTQKHLKSNPYLDLTPIFNDYIKHFKELDAKFGSERSTKDSAASSTASSVVNGERTKPVEPAKPTSSFFTTSSAAPEEKKLSFDTNIPFGKPTTSSSGDSSVISFGFGVDKQKSSDAPDGSKKNETPKMAAGFNFGNSAANGGGEAKTFSFGSSSSFSFGATAKNEEKPSINAFASSGFSFAQKDNAEAEAHEEEGAGGEDDHPPVVESVVVEEKDAFHTVKCKLFYKIGQAFTEKGVGNLYLKPLDGGKTQLLIRADTSLGNILLNVVVSDSMAFARTGKNNVTFVCVPNPTDAKIFEPNKPVMFLIRVKTGEQADELLNLIIKKVD